MGDIKMNVKPVSLIINSVPLEICHFTVFFRTVYDGPTRSNKVYISFTVKLLLINWISVWTLTWPSQHDVLFI